MSKKRKRGVALLLVFFLLFNLSPVNSRAADAPALVYSIETDGATENDGANLFYASACGDVVTVQFIMNRTDSQKIYALNPFQNEIEYDMSFFEYVEGSISVEKSGVDAVRQTRVRGQEIIKVSSLGGSGFEPEPLLCTFQLKIKDNAESGHGWIRCSETRAVSTDYVSIGITEKNLDVYLKTEGLTVTATGYSGSYDGTEHIITAEPNIADGTTLAYSTDNGVNWTETAPSLRNVGYIQVKVRAENASYSDAFADAVLDVKTRTLTVRANFSSKIYGDADPEELTVNVENLVTGDTLSGAAVRDEGEDAGSYPIRQGTLSAGDNYVIDFQPAEFQIFPKNISEASVSLSAHTLNYTGAEQSVTVNAVTLDGVMLTEDDYNISGQTRGTDAKTYTLTIQGKGNYTGTVSCDWKITESDMNVTAENVSVTYDKQPHSITVTGAPDGAEITYSEDGENYSAENPAYTDAGEIRTVYYKVSAANYDDFMDSATIAIAKRPVTVSGVTAQDKPFDGNTDVTFIYTGVTFDGIVDGDSLTVTATGQFENAEAGNDKRVNITGLTLGGTDAGNYQLAANGQQDSTTASITANETGVTASGYSGVYDGQTHSITVNAPEGAAVTYSETENGTYSTENPAYKDTGNYTVYYKVSLEGYGDIQGNAPVSITKATLNLDLKLINRSNLTQERNVWPYRDIPGIPSLTAKRNGLTEVNDMRTGQKLIIRSR